MNTAYTEVRGSFKMYPWLSAEQWASLKIGLGLFVSLTFFYKFTTGGNYEHVEYTAAPMPSTEYDNAVAKYSSS